MKFVWIITLLLVPAGPLWAQLSLSDSYRVVLVSGYAKTSSDPEYPRYALTNDSFGLGTWSATVSSNVSSVSHGTGPYGLDISAYASSRASQISTLASSGVTLSSDLTAQTWSDLSGWGGECSAEARSLLNVNISVPAAQEVEVSWLTSTTRHDYPILRFGTRLSGPGVDPIFSISETQPYFGDPFRCQLQPDTVYTLTLWSTVSAATPDPFGELGSLHLDFRLTPVPEPGTMTLCLLGLGTFARRLRGGTQNFKP